jgi:hypothetical protein
VRFLRATDTRRAYPFTVARAASRLCAPTNVSVAASRYEILAADRVRPDREEAADAGICVALRGWSIRARSLGGLLISLLAHGTISPTATTTSSNPGTVSLASRPWHVMLAYPSRPGSPCTSTARDEVHDPVPRHACGGVERALESSVVLEGRIGDLGEQMGAARVLVPIVDDGDVWLGLGQGPPTRPPLPRGRRSSFASETPIGLLGLVVRLAGRSRRSSCLRSRSRYARASPKRSARDSSSGWDQDLELASGEDESTLLIECERSIPLRVGRC